MLRETFDHLVREISAACQAHYGDRLVSLAVFGSVARHTQRPDSDIDLLVEPPADAGIKDVLALRDAFQTILGRPVDLVTYAGLRAGLDDDIRREAVLL